MHVARQIAQHVASVNTFSEQRGEQLALGVRVCSLSEFQKF